MDILDIPRATVNDLPAMFTRVPCNKPFWVVVWNMAFIFPNSWDDDPI